MNTYSLVERGDRVMLLSEIKDSDIVIQTYQALSWKEARAQIKVNDYGHVTINKQCINHQPGYGYKKEIHHGK